MTILCDTQIKHLCEQGLVSPYDPSLVGPASLDVRLGETIKVPKENTRGFDVISIADYTFDNPYWLKGFTLGHTKETFNIPNSLCAFFSLKSSRGREGISHALSGFCDPGWNGSKLTLELHALTLPPNLPAIWPGMRIGQIVFMCMDKEPETSYSQCGHYNNDATVMESKGYFD